MKISSIAQWVTAALRKKKISQAELGRRLTKELRREIDRAAVNKMVKGTRDVAADEMLAIEAITGLAIPSPNIPVRVPLIDRVTAGKLAEPKSQIPTDDVPLLPMSDLGPGEFFALRVEGDSMDRISPDGSVIVINRKDKKLSAGKPYVFFHPIEGTTFKLWQPRPKRLEPYSWNAANKTIFLDDAKEIEVVGRVRRTILDLP